MEGPWRVLDALVDTGSIYSWVPGTLLEELGLTATDNVEFQMANGESEFRDAVEALIRIDGRVRHTICIFGAEKDLVLLGAYALEGFGLAADPVNQRLVRVPTLPAAIANGQPNELEGGTP
jgi:predicted aspartyl protease